MPVSFAIVISISNIKKKGSIEISYLTCFGIASVHMLLDFFCFVVTRGVAIFFTAAGRFVTSDPGV